MKTTTIAKLAAAAVGLAYTSGDVFAAALKVPDTAPGTYRVTVAISSSQTLSVNVSDGTTSAVLTLNSGVALVAESLYAFCFAVQPGWTYNFRFGAATTIRVLQVDYVAGGVL